MIGENVGNIGDILQNSVVRITFLVWVITQAIKVFLAALKEKTFDFRWLIGTGGMPSSHCAGAAAMATTVGLAEGFKSMLFGVAFLVTLVTMFDAQGVRRASGKQAHILNVIIKDVYHGRTVEEKKLKELLGHTPVEVLAGTIIGCLLALIFYGNV